MSLGFQSREMLSQAHKGCVTTPKGIGLTWSIRVYLPAIPVFYCTFLLS